MAIPDADVSPPANSRQDLRDGFMHVQEFFESLSLAWRKEELYETNALTKFARDGEGRSVLLRASVKVLTGDELYRVPQRCIRNVAISTRLTSYFTLLESPFDSSILL